jgi:hypothetical protein
MQRLDQIENRMRVDQQWNMQSHQRQDDMLRYMMAGMRLDVPPSFSGLIPPPAYGEQHQSPYTYGQYPGYDQWGGQSGYGYTGEYGWQAGEDPMEEERDDE